MLMMGTATWGMAALRAQMPDEALQRELRLLGDASEELNHSLPSLTCTESAASERLVDGKVKKRVTFTASLRAVRTNGGPLHESFTMTTVNGKPYKGKDPGLPYYTGGGFDSAMTYFLPAHQACYRYTLRDGRIDFETAADVAAHSECRDDMVHGYALLDEEGHVTHLERTVGAEATRDFRLVPYAAIDFALVDLNGRSFRLSSHMVSDFADGRFEASYSECKLFTASVTIGPATPVQTDDHGSGGIADPANPNKPR